MISPYAVLAFFILLIAATQYQSIADAYVEAHPDDERGRYGASFREVMAWWWGGTAL